MNDKERRALALYDNCEEDCRNPKYYLKSDTVAELIKRAPLSKLRPYINEPAFTADKLYWYAKGRCGEYGDLSDEETRDLANLAYDLAKRRITAERRQRNNERPPL